MTTVPCPRCGISLKFAAESAEEVCPHCLTPRANMELEAKQALVRKEELRLKLWRKLIAACVLLPAAWFLRGLVNAPLGVAWREFQIEVENIRQPGHWIKPATAEPAVIVTDPVPFTASNARPEVAVSSFIYLDHNALSIVAPPLSVIQNPADAVAAPVPPTPHQYLRLWYGVVYDLVTLKPITNANLLFKARGDTSQWSTTTDAAGHYLIALHKSAENNPLLVSIDNPPGYREGLIEDRDPPLRELSRDARRMILEETADSDLEPVPLRCKESAEVVELNLVLIPLVKK